MTINDAIAKYRDLLLSIPGVTGIGVGKENDEQVVVVLVDKDSRKLLRRLPAKLEGFRIIVRESGVIRAY